MTNAPLVQIGTDLRLERQRRDPILLACCVLLIAGHLGMFWLNRHEVQDGWADFGIFYAGAKIVRDGLGESLYDFELQRFYLKEFSNRWVPLSFNHAPFELLFFLPFSFFSYQTAFVLWGWANVGLLLLIAMLLRRYGEKLEQRLPMTLLLFSFFPIAFAILQGQDSILLLLFYALAFMCFKRGREFTAGGVLALGLFKFQLILPFMCACLIGKKWKILRGFLFASAILALISVSMVGWTGVESYVHLLRQQNKGLADQEVRILWQIYPKQMPNLRGFTSLLFLGRLPDIFMDILVFVSSLALVIWSGRKWLGGKKADGTADLAFSLNIVVSLLASYHLHLHDATLLILPIVVIATRMLEGVSPSKLSKGYGAAILPFFLSPLQMLLMFWYETCALLFIPILALALLISAEIKRCRVGARLPGGSPPCPSENRLPVHETT